MSLFITLNTEYELQECGTIDHEYTQPQEIITAFCNSETSPRPTTLPALIIACLNIPISRSIAKKRYRNDVAIGDLIKLQPLFFFHSSFFLWSRLCGTDRVIFARAIRRNERFLRVARFRFIGQQITRRRSPQLQPSEVEIFASRSVEFAIAKARLK